MVRLPRRGPDASTQAAGTANRLTGRVALVTGATGFIGGALARRLVQAGASVHAVTRKERAGLAGGIRWWRGNLTNLAEVRTLLAKTRPHCVFHLAGLAAGGREPEMVQQTLEANFLPVLNLLLGCQERGIRLVLAGSLEEPAPDGTWPVPSSPYAASKLAAGAYARMFHALYGTEAIWLRLFMVYGPAQPDLRKLVPYVTLSLLRGEAPRLSSGTRPVDWIYIDDVVDAFLAAALKPGVEGRSLDIGSGQLVPIRTVVDELVMLIDRSITPRFGAVPDRPLEQVSVANVETTAAALGWRPRTTLPDGLARTVEWFRAQHSSEGRAENP
jgi:UDP-glucose 4-epimerase